MMSSAMNEQVRLHPLTTDKLPTLARLLQLYLHDFSQFAGPDTPYGIIENDGLFSYDSPGGLDAYITDPSRHAFLIHRNEALAGFAMINDWSPSGIGTEFCVAEFFIMRKYRRTGLGMNAAHRLFAMFKGQWELGVIDDNKPALPFWRNVVRAAPAHTVQTLRSDGVRWHDGTIFRFSTG